MNEPRFEIWVRVSPKHLPESERKDGFVEWALYRRTDEFSEVLDNVVAFNPEEDEEIKVNDRITGEVVLRIRKRMVKQ